jgi:hypothetical protein
VRLRIARVPCGQGGLRIGVLLLLGSACAPPPGTGPGATPSTPVRFAAGSAIDHRMGLAHDPRVAAALRQISADTLRATDSMLVSFGTRHTMSDTLSSTRGIGAARRWIHSTLSRYSRECNGCLRIEYDTATVVIERHPDKPAIMNVNVLAWLPGRDTGRVVVIGGHYDSCVCAAGGAMARFETSANAPGADDDGSGTSAVIELARVFARAFPRGLAASVIFALYSGEELGLLGSTALAQRLHRSGYRVVAGMTDDIIGNVVADDGRVDSTSVRVFSGDPDNGPSRELARLVWGLGATYTPELEVVPVFRLDRVGRGGDHAPFWRLNDAGVRFTERLENYKRQHLPTDRLEDVNFGYVAKVARLNAAVVGSLASAPATPDSARARRDAASGGQYWRLTWKPVAGARGYEVLLRATTSPTYERVIDIGADTTYLLREQLDDAWAAVRAVGSDGHRSIAAVVPPPSFVTR